MKMKIHTAFNRYLPWVTLAIAIPSFSTVWAHHSHGNYQMTDYTHLEGTVIEMHWMNPHTWIYLEITDAKGDATVWALEGASPNQLMDDGWRKDSISVGDVIKARCHQLRDGSNGCLLGFITLPGGVEKEWD